MKIPTQLKKEKLRFVRLKVCGKIPFEKGWQNKRHTYKDLELHQGNIGIQGGKGGLFVLDFDSKYAHDIVKDYLPPTFIVASAGKKLPHYYYIDNKSEEIVSSKYFLKNGNTAIDILGKGKQAVIPYSKVRNKFYMKGAPFAEYSYYNVITDMPITHVCQKTILDILDKIFVADDNIKTNTYKPRVFPPRWKTESSDRVDNIKGRVSISQFFNRMGVSRNGRLWDTPFGSSVNKKCVDIDDRKGVWFDFHNDFGGDLITAARKYWDCGFLTALDKLEEEFNL